ncbi:lipase maturation factor family protein [Rhodococcus sp. HNM0569]|uniref:lipase maturation factor family protein n=1 Tax=Rhodococcus sp. HNM0569 TaxID=2716340 RepID=UPI00146CA294|nr:lipase maturation factor family protein [Rhodococcus sp. HNM0569]NLU85053.1 lipase maturation factor family protein [Rhodococcus sp. HNM0569]
MDDLLRTWFVANDYAIGAWVFRKGLAALYLVAFVAALRQFRALLGTRGLTPIPDFVAESSMRASPSVFHWRYTDRFFAAVAWVGVAVSAGLLFGLTEVLPLPALMACWALLWLAYLSIVNVGQIWYGFGWESLLLEAGFLAVFLGGTESGPSWLVLILLRWLLFRLEFGAGMIKMRGDACWRRLTCLDYHHETQPMPGPFSWYFHRLPAPLHRIETAGNHVVQLVVPFGLFLPQPVAGLCALAMIVTQLWLVASGNFAWLNWVTIVLAATAVPDSFYRVLPGVGDPGPAPDASPVFAVVVAAVTVLVLVLSYRPARNLLSRRQRMNTSFDSLHLVNSYGAFGSVTRSRYEVVVAGTDDPDPGDDTVWREYEFKGKPGDPLRRPPQWAPYHLRLDWLMWFVAISPSYGRGWFERFVRRIAEGDPETLKLLRTNPFPDAPPAHVRVQLYRYRFTTRSERRATGAWWVRAAI